MKARVLGLAAAVTAALFLAASCSNFDDFAESVNPNVSSTDVSATVSMPDGAVTFSPASPTVVKGVDLTVSVAQTGYASYAWYLDGTSQSSTTYSITIGTSSLIAGTHELMCVVKDSSGTVSSGSCRFTVTN